MATYPISIYLGGQSPKHASWAPHKKELLATVGGRYSDRITRVHTRFERGYGVLLELTGDHTALLLGAQGEPVEVDLRYNLDKTYPGHSNGTGDWAVRAALLRRRILHPLVTGVQLSPRDREPVVDTVEITELELLLHDPCGSVLPLIACSKDHLRTWSLPAQGFEEVSEYRWNLGRGALCAGSTSAATGAWLTRVALLALRDLANQGEDVEVREIAPDWWGWYENEQPERCTR